MTTMADDIVESLREVASRWHLAAVQREVEDALAQQKESERPYVATNLIRALDMFVDAYS